MLKWSINPPFANHHSLWIWPTEYQSLLMLNVNIYTDVFYSEKGLFSYYNQKTRSKIVYKNISLKNVFFFESKVSCLKIYLR